MDRNKNIFIIGQPRVGKTTLTEILSKVLSNCSIFSLDEVRQAFVETYPDSQIYEKGTRTEINYGFQLEFETFVQVYIRQFKKKYPNTILIIEGMEIPIERIKQTYPDDIIIGLGINAEANEFYELLLESRENNNQLDKEDWTIPLSEKQLQRVAEKITNFSYYDQYISEKLHIQFFACEKYRDEDYFKEIVDYILKELNLNNESE